MNLKRVAPGVEIIKSFEFHAAHHLPWHKGKCKNPHGHSYKVEVAISRMAIMSFTLDANNVVMDFDDLKKIMAPIIEQLDHHDLNDLEQFNDNPTAESIALFIFDEIKKELDLTDCYVHTVRLWETSTSSVIVYARD